MTTATMTAAPSPAREGQPAKRKTAARRLPTAQEALEAADKAVTAAQASRARALARIEEEARQARIAAGRGLAVILVERLDHTARELVAAQLLGVVKENESPNVQEWLASLAAKG